MIDVIEVLKEMFTFSKGVKLFGARFTSGVIFIFANYDIIKSSDLRFMIIFNAVFIGFWLLGYCSRRPHPNEKPLIIWLKICILKVQIWNKQAYLYFYPDLKKYRGNQKRKAKVWAKRNRVKKLKRKLKEIV